MVSSPTKSSEKSEKWGEFPLQVSKLGYKFEISDQTAIGKSQNQRNGCESMYDNQIFKYN